MEIVHRSVMLAEVLEYLVPPEEDCLLVDCTLGEGGHTEAFLERYPRLRALGLDADRGIQEKARARLSRFEGRMSYYNGFYDDFFIEESIGEAPGLVLFDLGISMFHYVESRRGFSFQRDEDLDMRLDDRIGRTASDIVNGTSERELSRIIAEYGEERFARRIASAIVAERAGRPVRTSGALAEIVARSVPGEYRRGRVHPATRTFQALRIAVNDELGRVERAVEGAARALMPGGLVGVISFHSLEDRIVKNAFKSMAGRSISPGARPIQKEGDKAFLELVTKKPIVPGPEEERDNPPSRSAKLRVARKLP